MRNDIATYAYAHSSSDADADVEAVVDPDEHTASLAAPYPAADGGKEGMPVGIDVGSRVGIKLGFALGCSHTAPPYPLEPVAAFPDSVQELKVIVELDEYIAPALPV